MLEIQQMSADKIQRAKEKVLKGLNQLQKGSVLIVGDLCVDEYLFGDAKRISPEAPVPVVDVNRHETRLGLAAFVGQNLVTLGSACHLVGVIGEDSTGEELVSKLAIAGIDSKGLVRDKSRPTTRKTRIIAGTHHIARVDFEKRQFLSEQVEKSLLDQARNHMEGADVIVLQDYGKGVFSRHSCQELIREAKSQGKAVIVDPHRTTPVDYYFGANLFKPNRDESYILSGLNIDDLRDNEDSLARIAQALREKVACENLVMTLGAEGLLLINDEGARGCPTQAQEVFDVTGAGDTVLATLALAWASGFSLEESCVAANCAASVVVGKVGCLPCHLSELEKALKD